MEARLIHGRTGIALLQFVGALLLAPLFVGIVNRCKAIVAGRKDSPPAGILRHREAPLERRRVSRTTTWVFRAGPTAACAAVSPRLPSPLGEGRHSSPSRGRHPVCRPAGLCPVHHDARGPRHRVGVRRDGASREAWFPRSPSLRFSSPWGLSRVSPGASPWGDACSRGSAAARERRFSSRRRGLIVYLSENSRMPWMTDDTPRAHHDPRGDGPRSRRHRPRLHPLRGCREAVGPGGHGDVDPRPRTGGWIVDAAIGWAGWRASPSPPASSNRSWQGFALRGCPSSWWQPW